MYSSVYWFWANKKHTPIDILTFKISETNAKIHTFTQWDHSSGTNGDTSTLSSSLSSPYFSINLIFLWEREKNCWLYSHPKRSNPICCVMNHLKIVTMLDDHNKCVYTYVYIPCHLCGWLIHPSNDVIKK